MKRVRHSRMTAYLSGGMQFAIGGGADWRVEMGTWLREVLHHRAIDPVQESRRLISRWKLHGHRLTGSKRTGGDWPAFFRQIVDSDCAFVQREADYVICLWNASARKGAGTQGEVTVARVNRIPVFLVSQTPLQKLPGWIQGCTTRHFSSFRALRMYLIQRYYRPV